MAASSAAAEAQAHYDRAIEAQRAGDWAKYGEEIKALGEALSAELARAVSDDTVRVLIVTGAGAAFSSGFDLKEQMERRPKGMDAWRDILRKDFDTIMRFWHFRAPTIAAEMSFSSSSRFRS